MSSQLNLRSSNSRITSPSGKWHMRHVVSACLRHREIQGAAIRQRHCQQLAYNGDGFGDLDGCLRFLLLDLADFECCFHVFFFLNLAAQWPKWLGSKPTTASLTPALTCEGTSISTRTSSCEHATDDANPHQFGEGQQLFNGTSHRFGKP